MLWLKCRNKISEVKQQLCALSMIVSLSGVEEEEA